MLTLFLPMIIATLVFGSLLLIAQYVLITRQPDIGSEARYPPR